MKALFVSGLFLFLPTISSTSHATQAMAAPECMVQGHVMSQNVRFEEKDVGFARSWGIPQTVEYQDVTVKLSENKYSGEAQKELAQVSEEYPHFHCENTGRELVYQLRHDDSFKKGAIKPSDLVGNCISALSHFSGDEFVIGNWLYDIKILPESDCPGLNGAEN